LPFKFEEQVYFRPLDFIRFMNHKRATKIEKNRLYSILERAGTRTVKKTIVGRKRQLWAYPVAQINEQTEAFSMSESEFSGGEI